MAGLLFPFLPGPSGPYDGTAVCTGVEGAGECGNASGVIALFPAIDGGGWSDSVAPARKDGRAKVKGVQCRGEVGGVKAHGSARARTTGTEARTRIGRTLADGILNPTDDELMAVLMAV